MQTHQTVRLKWGPRDGQLFIGPTNSFPNGEITARVEADDPAYYLLYVGYETLDTLTRHELPMLGFAGWMPTNLHPEVKLCP